MIIEIPKPTSLPKAKKSWATAFKRHIYHTNFVSLLQTPNSPAIQSSLLSTLSLKQLNANQAHERDKETNSPCCSYIPLVRNVKMDDELLNTFIHFRNLNDNDRSQQLNEFYTAIRKFIEKSKDTNQIQAAWTACLSKFAVSLDILSKIQVYLQISKAGTCVIEELHHKLNPYCLKEIFFQSAMGCAKFFREEVKINSALRVSIENKEEITETSISKTMKMLYCSICLIYDCGKHKMEQICHQKQYRFISPKNLISNSVHILNAIDLYKNYHNLLTTTTTDQCSQSFQAGDDSSTNFIQISKCGESCYKNLNHEQFLRVEAVKMRIVSPLIDSLIKIGLQMFSYKPCLIISLFPKDPYFNTLTCSTLFAYLMQEGSIYSLIDNKMANSLDHYLIKQNAESCWVTAQIQQVKRRGRKKKKIKSRKVEQVPNVFSMKEDKYQQISLCTHSFIGEEIFDPQCLNCSCIDRGFCIPQCQCSDACGLMIQGCSCRGKDDCQTSKCSCFQNKTECIPGVCLSCFECSESGKKNWCKNDEILRKKSKMIRVGSSEIADAGLGAFAGQAIAKGSLVSIYYGEIIEQEIENIRQIMKKDESFYNFGCFEGSADARYMGNRSRFINHANENEGKANLMSLKMFSDNQEYIALYSLRDIQQGEELYFDYDISGEVGRKHGTLYPYLKKTHIEIHVPD